MAPKFETIAQFREIGGYKTQDGRTIRYGQIYRSGELTRVSAEEQALLASLNIKTVYDLRSTKEQQALQDVPGNYDVVLCPLAQEKIDVDVKYRNPAGFTDRVIAADESYYNFYKHSFAKGYLEFAYNTATISKIFGSMSRHEIFLYHCFGGKDRTGFISMLLMHILGCDYETCKTDYMLHNSIIAEKEGRYLEKLREKGANEFGIKTARVYSEAAEELFDCAWHSIYSLYNTIDDYLSDRFGIGPEVVNDWKNFYLE